MASAATRSLFGLIAASVTAAALPDAPAIDEAPGTIHGSANVSENGVATYSIPIEAPAGTGGMQPELTLRYSSQSGLGPMGHGWSIGGYSRITRGPKNITTDGVTAGTRFDDSDALYLDGQRLIPVEETSEYLEYRTEVDSHTRIRKLSAAAGPRFRVWTREGRILSYGSTRNSRPSLKDGTAILWLCDCVQDRSGNEMHFKYTESTDDANFDLATVLYTGNPKAGLQPYARVDFTFTDLESSREAIPHLSASFSYIHGERVTRRGRLTEVVSSVGDERLMTLKLVYEDEIAHYLNQQDPDRPAYPPRIGFRLAAVQKFGRGGRLSHAPTVFRYSDSLRASQAGWRQIPDLRIPGEVASGQGGTIESNGVRYADVNGDGLDDLLYSTSMGGRDVRLTYLNEGSGWNKSDAFALDVPLAIDGELAPGVFLRDVNGDSKADVLVNDGALTYGATATESGWIVHDAFHPPFPLSEPLGGGQSGSRKTGHFWGDLDGDGLLEFVWADGAAGDLRAGSARIEAGAAGQLSWTSQTSAPFPARLDDTAAVAVLDLDGDGGDDVVILSKDGQNVMAWTAETDGNELVGWQPFSLPDLTPAEVRFIEAVDLDAAAADGNGAKELIVYGELESDAEDPDRAVRIFGLDESDAFGERKIQFPVAELVQSGQPLGFKWTHLDDDGRVDILAYTAGESDAEGDCPSEVAGVFVQDNPGEDVPPQEKFDHSWQKDEATDYLPGYPLAARTGEDVIPLPVFLPRLTRSGKDDLVFLPRDAVAGVALPTPLTYINATGTWQLSTDYAPPAEISFATAEGPDASVKTIDFNADGLTDVVRARMTREDGQATLASYAAVNRGVEWEATERFAPPLPILDVEPGTGRPESTGATFVDVNGDARVDMLIHRTWSRAARDTEAKSFLNTAKGWQEAKDHWNSPTPIVDAGQDLGVRFIDLDADGLTDVLKCLRRSDGTTEYAAWRNTGTGWVEHAGFGTFPSEVGFGFVYQHVQKPDGGWVVSRDEFQALRDSHTQSFDLQATLIDLNKDRLPDIVFHFTVPTIAREEITDSNGNPAYRLTQDRTTVKGAFLNTGSGWVLSEQFTPPRPVFTWAPDPPVSYHLQDLNADGHPDLLYLDYAAVDEAVENRSAAFMNTGLGWSEPEAGFQPPGELAPPDAVAGNAESDRGIRLADINGDALPDLVQSFAASEDATTTAAFLNTGGGWLKTDQYAVFEGIDGRAEAKPPVFAAADGQGSGTQLLDVNGDFIVDVVRSWSDGSKTVRSAHLNQSIRSNMLRLVQDGSWRETEFDYRTLTMGLNARLVPDDPDDTFYKPADPVRLDEEGRPQSTLLVAPPPLHAVERLLVAEVSHTCEPDEPGGQGEVVARRLAAASAAFDDPPVEAWATPAAVGELSRQRSRLALSPKATKESSFGELKQPQRPQNDSDADRERNELALRVLSKVLPDRSRLRTTRSLRFQYAGFRVDRTRGDPVGFATVKRTNAATRTVMTSDYRQDAPFIGRVYSERVVTLPDNGSRADAGKTQTDVASEWDARGLEGNTGANGHTMRYSQVWLRRSVSAVHDPHGKLLGTQTDEMTPDGYGNTTVHRTTRSDGSSIVLISEFINREDDWNLGKVTRTSIERADRSGAKEQRTATFEYDNNSGLVLQETSFSGTPLALTRRHLYDAFGNRTETTTTAADVAPRTERVELDTRGRFQTAAVDPLGFRSHTRYDDLSGNLLESTDAGSRKSKFEYDALGELTEFVSPSGLKTVNERYRIHGSSGAGDNDLPDMDGADQLGATTFVSMTRGALPAVRQYTDDQGRVLRQAATAWDGGSVYRDARYDVQKRLRAVSQPYHSEQTEAVFSSLTGEPTGRPQTARDIRGNEERFGYDAFETTVNVFAGGRSADDDKPDRVRSRIHNLQRQLVATIAEDGGRIEFGYDVGGRLCNVRRADGSVLRYWYDRYGRLAAADDPSRGCWRYSFNSLGELTCRTDASGRVTTYAYDRRGRLVEQRDGERISRWVYDSAANGIDRIHVISSSDGYREEFSYDSAGRTRSRTAFVEGKPFTTWFEHDEYDRLTAITYPTGQKVCYRYDDRGYLTQIVDRDGRTIYWQALAYDARGNVTSERLGNGVVTSRKYDHSSGDLLESASADRSGKIVVGRGYRYDAFGNVLEREDLFSGRRETFTYDELDRITSASIGPSTVFVDYDSTGRILYKSDVGHYRYGQPQFGTPADGVVAVDHPRGGTTLRSFDRNGNLLGSSLGERYTYTAGNRLRSIGGAAASTTSFCYTPDGQVYLQREQSGRCATTTATVGLYEQESRSISLKGCCHVNACHRCFVPSPSGVCAVLETKMTCVGDASCSPLVVMPFFGRMDCRTRYVHTDSLGSVIAQTGEFGEVVARQHFDAWGRRAEHCLAETNALNRGFTGHPSIGGDSRGANDGRLGVRVHMGARAYDPVLGQFSAADPVIQSHAESGSMNRYAYAWGNPLRYRDPTGMFLSEIGDAIGDAVEAVGEAVGKAASAVGDALSDAAEWAKEKIVEPVVEFVHENWRPIVVVAVTAAVATATFGAAAPAVGAFLAGTLSGAVSGAVGGGLAAALYGGDAEQIVNAMAKGAAMGALAGALMGAATQVAIATESGLVGKALTFGVLNGAVEEQQSGDYWLGFRSGLVRGISSIDAIRGFDNAAWARVGAAAISGGVMTEVHGTDAREGARTMAFLQLLREAPAYYRDRVGYELDAGPGDYVHRKDKTTPPVGGAKNFGIQGGNYDEPGFFHEGGTLSKIMNEIPTMNAIAGIHDAYQVDLGTGPARSYMNVPNMAPAALATWGGFVGQPISGVPHSGVIQMDVSGSRGKQKTVQLPVYAGP